MNIATFPEFESDAKAQGFDEVLERKWAPNSVVGDHSHPFEAKALVVQGEMWLTVGNDTQHLRRGGRFALQADVVHSERYGSEGAAYWVARRQRAAGTEPA